MAPRETNQARSENLALTFATNAVFKGLGELGIRLLAFAFIVLVARALGEEDFGVLNFANSFALLFVVVVDFGLNPLLIRNTAREPSRAAHFFYNLLLIKIILAVLFILVLGVGLELVSPGVKMRQTAYWLGGFILVNSFTEFINAFFNGYQRMQYEAGIMAFQKGVLLGMGVLALALGRGLPGVAIAYAAAGCCGLMAAGFLLHRSRLLAGEWKIEGKFLRLAMIQALPLTLTTLFINIYFRVDMILLAKLRPAAEVGWYGSAHKCIEVMMVIPAVLVAAAFPGFSRLFLEDRERLLRVFSKVVRLLLLLGMPMAGGAILIAQPLMVFIFGKAYAAAGIAFTWLALALCFIFLNYPLSFLLISAERQKVNALASGLAVGVSVSANLFFIPRFGHAGAAFSALLTEAVLFGAYWLAVHRTLFHIPFLKIFPRILGATGIMLIGLWWVKGLHPLISILMGGAIYAVAVLGLKAVQPEDWQLLRRIWPGGRHA